MFCASAEIPAPLRMAQSDRPALCETFPLWLIGLLFSVAVACIKTASSPGQAHNELSVQRGYPSQLSGNKQWPVDNSSLVQLSQSCSYIRTTGKSLVCLGKMGLVIWNTRKLFAEAWEWDTFFCLIWENLPHWFQNKCVSVSELFLHLHKAGHTVGNPLLVARYRPLWLQSLQEWRQEIQISGLRCDSNWRCQSIQSDNNSNYTLRAYAIEHCWK